MDLRTRPLDIRQAVGFMPEDECLFPGVAGSRFRRLCGRIVRNVAERCPATGPRNPERRRPGRGPLPAGESYSTGMKQRLKLASALVHDPRLLILDEPTNGMDPAGRQEILELARDLAHGKEMSLLFSSHLLPDVEFVCDYVVVLGQGRLLAQGKSGIEAGGTTGASRSASSPMRYFRPASDRSGVQRRRSRTTPCWCTCRRGSRNGCSGRWPPRPANRSATCGRNRARWKKFSEGH